MSREDGVHGKIKLSGEPGAAQRSRMERNRTVLDTASVVSSRIRWIRKEYEVGLGRIALVLVAVSTLLPSTASAGGPLTRTYAEAETFRYKMISSHVDQEKLNVQILNIQRL